MPTFIELKRQIDAKLKERFDPLQTNMDQADAIQAEIFQIIQVQFLHLHCDYIIETLTHFGWAPQVIYDDNGHFAISTAGYAPVSENLIEGTFTAFVKKDQWATSIREALAIFLDNLEPDEPDESTE